MCHFADEAYCSAFLYHLTESCKLKFVIGKDAEASYGSGDMLAQLETERVALEKLLLFHSYRIC